jgi:hypothetical protein
MMSFFCYRKLITSCLAGSPVGKYHNRRLGRQHNVSTIARLMEQSDTLECLAAYLEHVQGSIPMWSSQQGSQKT